MYDYDLDAPIFAHMHVHKVRSHATLYPLSIIKAKVKDKVKIKNKVKDMHILTANISQTMTDKTNITIANTESHMRPFDWHICI